jgi:hypothetical protein
MRHGAVLAADAFATWAGVAAFGFRMNAAMLFVGFATGMVFTRRTGCGDECAVGQRDTCALGLGCPWPRRALTEALLAGKRLEARLTHRPGR